MLKYKYASQDEIPESFQALYAESGGEWILQVDKIEGVSPNAKVKKFRDDLIELRDERDELAKKLSVFEDVDVEEYQTLKSKREEFEDGEYIKNKDIEGLIEERTKRMADEHTKEVNRFQSVLDGEKASVATLKSELSNVKINNALSSEALKVEGINPAFHDIIVMMGKELFKMNDNNEPEAIKDGETVYGKDGINPITINEWVKSIPDTRPEFMLDSNGMDTNGSGKQNSHSKSQLSKMNGKGKLQAAFDELL